MDSYLYAATYNECRILNTVRLEPIMLLKLPIMLLSNALFFHLLGPMQLCSISHLITAIFQVAKSTKPYNKHLN